MPECHGYSSQVSATAPILRMPKAKGKYTIYTDASDYSVGSILSQTDEEGVEGVIGYDSKTLNPAQMNYDSYNREALGLHTALKRWRNYISGAHFDVVTDNDAVRWLLSHKEPTSKIARWI